MRTSWMLALVAGAAIAAAPAELMAQGNSNRARQQQQQQQAREQARRNAEREQIQRQREAQRVQAARGTIRRDGDRFDDRNRRDDDRRYDDRYDNRDRYDDRYDDRYKKNGPAFCRSGQGHPVHGRQWCRQKGYGLGNERSRDIWGDIIFRQPRDRDRRYDDRTLSRGTLGDILGSVILGRFDSYGRTYYGSNGSLTGRWLPGSYGSGLQLYMGQIPIARLVDTNRDGRVDNVILTR
jgi:hypothetical protein